MSWLGEHKKIIVTAVVTFVLFGTMLGIIIPVAINNGVMAGSGGGSDNDGPGVLLPPCCCYDIWVDDVDPDVIAPPDLTPDCKDTATEIFATHINALVFDLHIDFDPRIISATWHVMLFPTAVQGQFHVHGETQGLRIYAQHPTTDKLYVIVFP